MNCRRFAWVAFGLLLVWAVDAHARTGGGHSYHGGHSSSHSSGSHHSHGSSGHSSSGGSSRSGSAYNTSSSSTSNEGCSSGCACAMVALLFAVIVLIIVIVSLRKRSAVPVATQAPADPFEGLRAIDPNFSRSVFEDFGYALYEHAHHARAAGDLDRYAPYISESARRDLLARNPEGLREVRGIVIGAMSIENIQVADRASVSVRYDANMTEVAARETSWYVKERWQFERARGVLSPPPAKAKAQHCPKCGGPLETRTDGSCAYCGAKINDGSFQWFVTAVHLDEKNERGPLLTSDVPEEGTNKPTVHQPHYNERFAAFKAAHPAFSMDAFLKRVREVAIELQNAWSSRDWERVRPVETDQLFQTHRYWIDAYIRQNLRNLVDDYAIDNVEPVKIDTDAFYDAITVRMWAHGRDYTIDANGHIVGGARDKVRRWTEYWTFIRTRGSEAKPDAAVSCPNCGASVKVGAIGICSSCGGKLTSGEFGWVLSRIEQDDDYVG